MDTYRELTNGSRKLGYMDGLSIAMNLFLVLKQINLNLRDGFGLLKKQRIWIGITSLSVTVREFVLARFVPTSFVI